MLAFPQEDGGSPITNYIVEKQDKATGKWVSASKFVRGTTYEVMGLEENHEYNFRVSAENEYGVSQPLETTTSVVAQYPYSECFAHNFLVFFGLLFSIMCFVDYF